MSLKPKQVDFDDVWVRVRGSLEQIIKLQTLDRRTWDDNFHDIYALCVAIPEAHTGRLYEKTKECLEQHVSALYKEVNTSNDDTVLENYHKSWTVFYQGAKFIHSLFGYLNTQVIRRQKFTEGDLMYGGITVEQTRQCMLEIGELALDIWRRVMIEPMKEKLPKLLLDAISRDRAGHSVYQSVISGVIQSFVQVEEYKLRGSLDLYQDLFEKPFLDATSDYYTNKAADLLAQCSCSEYMKKVLALIRDEDVRARKFINSSSFEKVTDMCQKVMVERHMETLHSVAKNLVEQEQKTDLSNMYTLLKPLASGLSVLVKEFENHVKRIGYDNVRNLKGENIPHQFVENMLNVYEKYSDLVREVFQGDQEFTGALDKACLHAINYKEDNRSMPKASEWLAKYTDHLLRRSPKNLSEQDIEQKLIKAIVIFRYIEDKDVFQKFYQRMLAQRLIHGFSVSMDSEEAMITKLKQACGYEFTSKLQRMFTDVTTSKDLTGRFISFSERHADKLDVGFQIMVLQAGAWPLQQSNPPPFAVPGELLKSVNMFEQFYNSNFTGRKLTWLYNLAMADVKLNYLSKMYTITMNVHQMAVLLHFNDTVAATAADIKTSTHLSGEILQKTLKTLVDSQLLICGQIDELIDESDIGLNLNYSNKRTKFKIVAPTIQKQTEREAEQVNSNVQNDRKYFLECIIVRIMKARKVLKHNQLIQEAISHSRARFSPEVPFIKKVIEQLIEKQYLQRTENADEYSYLA